MAVKFKERTKHGTLDLFPGVALAFDDEKAEDYFVAAGFAETTTDAPEVTYPVGSVEIDPDTIHADTGKPVLTADAPAAGQQEG